jgi:hypothetical protein
MEEFVMKLITELKIITGENANAPNGFVKLPIDLNKGAGGEYIYLCYKKEESDVGIVDIIVLHDDKADGVGNNFPLGYIKLDMDLNKGAKGEYIYFAYKKGTAEQSKNFGITDLTILDGDSLSNDIIHNNRNYIIKDVDLNKGAGGKYLYLAYKNVSNTSLVNWMSKLSNQEKLIDVSIPGTHDTMTYNLKQKKMYDLLDSMCPNGVAEAITAALPSLSLFGVIGGAISVGTLIIEFKKSGAEKLGKTQNFSLRTQLECGVRFVDIRINSNLECHHGIMTCYDGLETVLNVLDEFLKENKEEFVVMRLVVDNLNSENNVKFRNILECHPNIFLNKENIDITKLTVNEVRGKVICLYNVKGEALKYVANKGVPYSNDAFDIQDKYENPGVEEKYNLVEEKISKRNKEKLTLNYVSASMKSNITGAIEAFFKDNTTPIGYANKLNPRVERYLMNDKNIQNQKNVGNVIFDFVGSDLSWAVIKHNFGI